MSLPEAFGKAVVVACCVVASYAAAPSHWILLSVAAVLFALHQWSKNPDRTFFVCCAVAAVAVGVLVFRGVVVPPPGSGRGVNGGDREGPGAEAGGGGAVAGGPGRRGPHRRAEQLQQQLQPVEDDPILGGVATVLVIDPQIELVSEVLHVCSPEQEVQLTFVLRADPGEEVDFSRWRIRFVNELDNTTTTLENLTGHVHLSPTVATIKHSVRGPGVFKFRDEGDESTGQHCPIHRHAGVAQVVVHEPPALTIVRHDCEGPLYAVFSGSPPFVAATSQGELRAESSVELPADNATVFYELRDAHCATPLSVVAQKPVRTRVHVEREGEEAVVHVLAAGQPPLVLSYWRTDVSAASSLLPARVGATVDIAVRRTGGGRAGPRGQGRGAAAAAGAGLLGRGHARVELLCARVRRVPWQRDAPGAGVSHVQRGLSAAAARRRSERH